MHIEVGPARRPGNSFTIYDKPLEETDLEVGQNGEVVLTIRASGINCRKSLYRYKIRLSPHEAKQVGRGPSANGKGASLLGNRRSFDDQPEQSFHRSEHFRNRGAKSPAIQDLETEPPPS